VFDADEALCCARRGGAVVHERHVFKGDRAAIRAASVDVALRLIVAIATSR
jgi:hypothetical protein